MSRGFQNGGIEKVLFSFSVDNPIFYVTFKSLEKNVSC